MWLETVEVNLKGALNVGFCSVLLDSLNKDTRRETFGQETRVVQKT